MAVPTAGVPDRPSAHDRTSGSDGRRGRSSRSVRSPADPGPGLHQVAAAMERFVPGIDEGVRRRLRARFGAAIDPWLDEAAVVLAMLGERWKLEFGALIPHGSMSVIIRC